MAMVKIKGSVAKNLHGRTDWEKLKKMTDAEIKAAAASDPAAKIIDNGKLLAAIKKQK